MEIQQLRYVATLAQTLSFREAAERLFVTQPTLSQQVKKLEEELGAPLFERTPRSVRLTPAGSQFLPYALSILEREREAREVIAGMQSGESGECTLGVIPTIAPYLLPKALPAFQQRFPAITLCIQEAITSELLDRLNRGQIDAALLSLPINESGFQTVSLGREPFWVAFATGHHFSQYETVPVQEVAQEKLLLLKEGHCFRDQALDVCQQDAQSSPVVFEGDHLASLLALTAAGVGITLLPNMAIPHQPQDVLRFLPISDPAPAREVGLAFRERTVLSRFHEKLIELSQSVFQASTR